MKRIIVSLITVALLLSMTACGGLGRPEIVVSNSDKLTHITDAFEGSMAPQEILDELRGIDLTGKKINYSGMESETVTDEDSSTSITYYSKDGERVYAVYEGYGEECVDFYTETKSGYKATVKYTYPGTQEATAYITFEKDAITYNVSYMVLENMLYYDACDINITIVKNDDIYEECVTYVVDYSEGYGAYLESSKYINAQGEYKEYTYEMQDLFFELVDEEHVSPEVLLIGKYDPEKQELNAKMAIEFLFNAEKSELLIGPHTVYTDESGDFYIESTLTFIGEDEKIIDTLVKEYNFTKGRDIDDEFDIAYNDVVLKFASDCKVDGYENVFDFVMDEYNDYVYKSVSFNEDGEISKVSSGTLSYY